MNLSNSDLIASLALLVSTFSAWYAYRIGRSQRRLNELSIQQLEEARRAARTSSLTVEITGRAPEYVLTIANVGPVAAQDVFFDSDGPESEFVSADKVANPLLHFPRASIEPGVKLQYPYVRFMEHVHEPSFRLRWRDATGVRNEHFTPSLPLT